MSEVKLDGGGLRLNEGKLPLELVPPSAIFALGSVLAAGAKKYAPRNWERGMKWSVCYACCLRHLLKWFSGEDKDPETGLSHLYHALCNIAFLIEYEQTCPELDDRVKRKSV